MMQVKKNAVKKFTEQTSLVGFQMWIKSKVIA